MLGLNEVRYKVEVEVTADGYKIVLKKRRKEEKQENQKFCSKHSLKTVAITSEELFNMVSQKLEKINIRNEEALRSTNQKINIIRVIRETRK